jgi:ribosomal protein L11 methyltransferase
VIRTSCQVRADDVEAAMDVLLPRLPQGVHERAAQAGKVELSWFGGGRLEAELGALATDWAQEEAPADRASRRRRYGQPLVVGERLVVRAADDAPGPAGLPEVVIAADHGQFGTGAHPTTRQSLELLAALEPGGSFADLGCGSGVLAIAAARLGFAPVSAVDFEPGAVRMTQENAARNDVAIDVRRADLLYEQPPAAGTIVANLPLAVHRSLARTLPDEVRTLIVSGVIAPETGETIAAYAALRPVRRLEAAGWVTMLLERP